jgi:pyruvate dehydrogenase E1 component beta subunit
MNVEVNKKTALTPVGGASAPTGPFQESVVTELTSTNTAAPITLIEAITQALAWELAHDPSVLVLGEDVGINGGVFRATAGLMQRFGAERVLDTPLDETTIAGLSVGLAAQGMKPIAESQFDGFIYPMIDHLVSHAARLRNRTRGRLHCPMVLRVPWGGGIRAPEHHSEANEAMFTNVPGLRVVIPSSPQRAYGLLLAAIRDPDPVIYFEPKRIYRQYKEVVVDDGEALPLDVCFVLRDGTDVTLVAWGAQIKEALEAADKLAAEGISAEVIDVATLRPLDFDTIAESVARTGRCVIVQEAPRSAGFGAEIAARLAEHSMYDLLAPVERVTGYDTHIPLFRLEMKYLPSVERIVAAARRAVAAG